MTKEAAAALFGVTRKGLYGLLRRHEIRPGSVMARLAEQRGYQTPRPGRVLPARG